METKLQQYAKIQPMVKKDAEDIAKKVYRELGDKNKYEVTNIPYHQHNGTDSATIPFSNLADASSYRVIRKIALSSVQILALNTTPITLVPAPGTNTINVVEGITARINYVSVAYTGANALEFRYTDGSGVKVATDLPSTFLDSAANAYYHAPGASAALVPVANAPIVAFVPTANPAAGNSSITLVVVYRTVSFNI